MDNGVEKLDVEASAKNIKQLIEAGANTSVSTSHTVTTKQQGERMATVLAEKNSAGKSWFPSGYSLIRNCTELFEGEAKKSIHTKLVKNCACN